MTQHVQLDKREEQALARQLSVAWLVAEAYKPEMRLAIAPTIVPKWLPAATQDRIYHAALDEAGFKPDQSGPPRRNDQ